MRPKAKESRKQLRDKLDALVKAYVKRRDQNMCQMCGKHVEGHDCHVSHVVPVSAGIRSAYDPWNMKVLCYRCHFVQWHLNPLNSGRWYLEKFPERAKYLQENYRDKSVLPIKDFELQEMYDYLKSEIGAGNEDVRLIKPARCTKCGDDILGDTDSICGECAGEGG